jgi:glycosyltransferase involved in cell wall biosynthesis
VSAKPALLVALPCGLVAAGVAVWGVRAVNALARRGYPTGLIVHEGDGDHHPIAMEIDGGVRVFPIRGVNPLAHAEGDLSPYIAPYRDAVVELAKESSGRVVIGPNLLGDCYGIAAELTRQSSDLGGIVRVLGVQHSDIEYDVRVQMHYESIISAFLGVSERITSVLRARLSGRTADVFHLPQGVPVLDRFRARSPLTGRPVRLVYIGRMEQSNKRVFALIEMSRELTRRAEPHSLTLVGDGPVAEEIDSAAMTSSRMEESSIRRIPACGPREIESLLDSADILVLASRYEGMNLAMLEAMGRGCVPVVTRVASGAEEVIEDGVSGVLVTADEMDSEAVGRLMAEGVLRAMKDIAPRSAAAWNRVRQEFSTERHAQRLSEIVDRVAASPARDWPADRPCAFTSSGSDGSGSVPRDGAARLARVLESLRGRVIAIHGTGRHTIELRAVIESSSARVVAFADDDPDRQGSELWGRPVVPPGLLHEHGVTDVVIGSWMHEEAVWLRRGVYEGAGVRVHRLYGG